MKSDLKKNVGTGGIETSISSDDDDEEEEGEGEETLHLEEITTTMK